MNIAMFFTNVPSTCPDTVVGYHCYKCEIQMFYDWMVEPSMSDSFKKTGEEELLDILVEVA